MVVLYKFHMSAKLIRNDTLMMVSIMHTFHRINKKAFPGIRTKISVHGYKAIYLGICLSILLAACTSKSNTSTPLPASPTVSPTPVDLTPTKDNSSTQNDPLIFNEEFSGTQLDTSSWATEYRWGRTNNSELQYYFPDALKVQDGILHITAEKQSMEGMDYTSGMIASYNRFTFTYGYLEMRAKIPAGQGLWPAFWMHLNNDNKSGEIDIFEFLGNQPNIVHMAYHFPTLQEFSFTGPDYSQDYHTYAVDWEPNKIVWYIDGVERARATHEIPNEPMYIIVNLAVGGSWPGNPDETTHFPAYYDIDYIRVYKH
jgi:beta-glucanase (GH16 family)